MFEDNDLFEFLEREVDEAATSKKVKQVFKNYPRIKSMAMKEASIGASNLSFTGHIKKKGANSDSVGDSVARKIKAEQELKEIETALASVTEDYRICMKAKYDKSTYEHVMDIYLNLNMAERTFYRYIRKGEIQFAEAYKNGGLLVFKE